MTFDTFAPFSCCVVSLSFSCVEFKIVVADVKVADEEDEEEEEEEDDDVLLVEVYAL